MFVSRYIAIPAIAFAAPLAAGNALAADQLTVKIGHVAAVSGPLSYFGKDNENGARMAIDDLNARNITIGGKKARFVLLAEDDAGEPRLATVVAQKLVDARVNAVIGHETSGTSIPASKIYHDAGIPEISAATTSPVYTEQGFNTTFRVVVNDKQLGRTLGRYAVKDMKARRVALIDDRTAYGQGIATEFVKGLREAGGTIVTKEFTNDKATEFGAILTKVRATKPDLIFFGGMSAVAGPMLHQMKALGMGDLRLMGGDGICSDEIGTLAQGAMADGQVVCAEAGGIEDSAKAGLETFNAAYKKRFGIEVQIYAPYVYDSIMTIVDAMVKAGSSEPAKYLPVLAQIRHTGLTGQIAFDQRGDIRDGTLTLYTFKNGRRTRIAVTK
ncbi:MAG TPA: branched-chain amino acid ABC transporter substrate-binding protein [Ramlibacter sp.]